MSEFLQTYLKNPGIRGILSCLQTLKIRSYFVGGVVRDWLLGERTLDLDIVVLNWSPHLLPCIEDHVGNAPQQVSPFLTYRLLLPQSVHIDLARARKETYPKPGALPEVEPTTDMIEDLARRDFTINAMAVEIFPDAGQFHDPFQGKKDLREGWIRVLKPRSFRDDPTRAFRAIRYAKRFGFQYAPETEQEWANARSVLPDVSFERIKNEFKRFTLEPKAIEMAREVHRLGLLEAYHPQLHAHPKALTLLTKIPRTDESDWVLLFAPFTLEYPEVISLPLSREERKFFQDLHALLKDSNPGESLEAIHQKWKTADVRALRFVALLKHHSLLQEYAEKRDQTRLSVTGQYLKDLGLKGPKVGEILDRLFVEKLKGRLTSLKEELRYLHEVLLNQRKS